MLHRLFHHPNSARLQLSGRPAHRRWKAKINAFPKFLRRTGPLFLRHEHATFLECSINVKNNAKSVRKCRPTSWSPTAIRQYTSPFIIGRTLLHWRTNRPAPTLRSDRQTYAQIKIKLSKRRIQKSNPILSRHHSLLDMSPTFWASISHYTYNPFPSALFGKISLQ